MAARDAAVPVRRDERERVRGRPQDELLDEIGRDGCEAAESAFLPRRHERLDGRVVLDRGPGGAEGEATAGALSAALDGPRRGGAAARAQRAAKPGKRGARNSANSCWSASGYGRCRKSRR